MSTKNATVQPYVRPKIKDPLQDPVIAMSKARREKELKNDHNSRQMSAVSGALLHKVHDLKKAQAEIRELEDGVQEYQDQINLLHERKADIKKVAEKHVDWCATFDKMIGARRPPSLCSPTGSAAAPPTRPCCPRCCPHESLCPTSQARSSRSMRTARRR